MVFWCALQQPLPCSMLVKCRCEDCPLQTVFPPSREQQSQMQAMVNPQWQHRLQVLAGQIVGGSHEPYGLLWLMDFGGACGQPASVQTDGNVCLV